MINGLGTGGAERSLAELLPGYVARGVDPHVLCLFRRGEGVESRLVEGDHPPVFLSARGFAGRVREIRAWIHRLEPDLIHTTIFESDLVGRFAALGTATPVLTSLVNTPYEDVRLKDPNVRRWKLWAARTVDGWTARHLTDHFHAISHAVREASVRRLGVAEDRITVVERGRDAGRLGRSSPDRRAAARKKAGIGRHEEVVLSVGRQEYQKGQGPLLEAVGLLRERRPRVRALIAGRAGNATPDLERLHRRLGLGSDVHWLGHRADVPELLAAADLFVFPSLYEGLGGAVIEAMALGLPIVASRIPALEEVLGEGENALLVPPGDSSALARAMERLLEDRHTAERFGRRSRQIFEERFTLERSVEGMVRLYQSVARMRSSAPDGRCRELGELGEAAG